ncbi:MAG: AAA family ATPase [Pseudomonadota bacterium]
MSYQNLYLEFFGFRERPFTLVPDPAFLFWSAQHSQAYTILEFGALSFAPITVITGEIGAGKTTLIQALLADLSDDIRVGLVSNAQGGRGELLQWVLNSLEVDVGETTNYVDLFQAFQDCLLEEYAAGRRVILIIDEAQNLSLEGLEELRMLTNVNSNKDVLLQLILSGQPELRAMIRRPDMQQLAQRVAASFHLNAMDDTTVADYIAHRLKTAGGTGEEFSPEATQRIHQESGGIPRLVNQLCEFALLYAWSSKAKVVTAEMINQVLADGIFFGSDIPKQGATLLQPSVAKDG